MTGIYEIYIKTCEINSKRAFMRKRQYSGWQEWGYGVRTQAIPIG